jgi:hypothetical protein
MRFWQVLFASLTGVALGAFAACDAGGDGSDSNTNWLDCDRDSDCRGSASCLCGICSTGCNGSEECAALGGGAVCFEDVGGSSDCRLALGASRGACLPVCQGDRSCAGGLECVSGVCMPASLVPTPGDAGAGGSNGGTSGGQSSGSDGARGGAQRLRWSRGHT